jgi:hypothetical protein
MASFLSEATELEVPPKSNTSGLNKEPIVQLVKSKRKHRVPPNEIPFFHFSKQTSLPLLTLSYGFEPISPK